MSIEDEAGYEEQNSAMPLQARCGNCEFWFHSGGEEGRCRRYAPKPVTKAEPPDFEDHPRYEALWPLTWCMDVCGEHMRSTGKFEASK